MCNSNKGTGGMESSVVLFKPRIHLFACTHPSVSNSLDCNDWLAYMHQSTACVQTRLDCGSLLYTSISVHPLFQTRLGCGSLSAHTHQYPALCFKHVWIMVPCLCASISLQPFDQTRLDCGPCCLQASSPPCVSNTFGLWILLRTRISFQHCVSNTFGLWFRVWVQASASCFLGQTRLGFGSLLCTSISLHPCLKHVWVKVPGLRTRISPQPCVSNAFGLWIPVCAHASVSSLGQTRLIMVACLWA